MTTLGGQTFADAFSQDLLPGGTAGGTFRTPQPFFEAALGGTVRSLLRRLCKLHRRGRFQECHSPSRTPPCPIFGPRCTRLRVGRSAAAWSPAAARSDHQPGLHVPAEHRPRLRQLQRAVHHAPHPRFPRRHRPPATSPGAARSAPARRRRPPVPTRRWTTTTCRTITGCRASTSSSSTTSRCSTTPKVFLTPEGHRRQGAGRMDLLAAVHGAERQPDRTDLHRRPARTQPTGIRRSQHRILRHHRLSPPTRRRCPRTPAEVRRTTTCPAATASAPTTPAGVNMFADPAAVLARIPQVRPRLRRQLRRITPCAPFRAGTSTSVFTRRSRPSAKAWEPTSASSSPT